MEDWYPIETAPKDETPLQLYQADLEPRFRVFAGAFSTHTGNWFAFPGGYTRHPTHWQRLPAGPANQ